MSRLRSTAAALLAGAALSCCDGSGGTTAPEAEPTGTSPTDTPAAVTHPSRFDGRFGVVVQAGLKVGSDGVCVRARSRVCSVDRGEAYVPVRALAYATLEHASTHPADGRTRWTAVLEFADASRPAVMYAGRGARSVGGVLLVMTREHQVLVAAPYTQVHQGIVRLTDLDRRTAWDLVGLFVGG